MTDEKEQPRCGRCGQPARGYATVGNQRLCHDDSARPSCYELTLRASSERPASARDWTDDVADLVSNLQEIVDAYSAGNRPLRSCLVDLMEEHADLGGIIANVRAASANAGSDEVTGCSRPSR